MRKLALVFAGGFCGTLARYLLAPPLLALVTHLAIVPRGVPYDILVINVTGAFALGLLYSLTERGAAISPDVRLTLGTGFLGAYTTFSTFAYGGVRLLESGAWLAGTLYLTGSIALGVASAHAGYVSAGLISERRRLARRGLVRARRTWRQARSLIPGERAVQPWRLPRRSLARTRYRDERAFVHPASRADRSAPTPGTLTHEEEVV